MKKTILDLNQLTVDSFETDPAAKSPRGTVHAHAPTQFTAYCQCQYATSYGTCQGTCVDTCGGPTCDYPCQTANTCHLTCGAGCGWTDGQHVCRQTP
jgi:hypothetical protein